MRKTVALLVVVTSLLVGFSTRAEAVKAGQFCKKADRGTTTTADNGDIVTCLDSGGWRWVVTGATTPPATNPPTPPPTTTPPPPSQDVLARRLDTIRRLYRAYFLRDAEPVGLAYWRDAFGIRMTLIQISDFFAQSKEFQNRYGSLDSAGFVDLIYRNVLGRAADPGGRTHWIGVLDAGRNRGAVMIGFSESAEFVRKTGTLPPEGA